MINFNKPDVLKEADLARLLPNLKILDITHPFKQVLNHNETVAIIESTETIKGLIFEASSQHLSVTKHCKNLEMLATGVLEDRFIEIGYGSEIKQLYLWNYFLSTFSIFAQYFPKLKRLHIENSVGSLYEYRGPVLKNLEILEVLSSCCDETEVYHGFKLLDSCPRLKSAYFFIDSNQDFLNESIINSTVQDLVICYMPGCEQDWIFLKKFLSKFPNLKHLALRENDKIKDIHIEELIQILPNLILLDVRESFGVTQRSADYINRYCMRNNRSLSFYHKPGQRITGDWSHLSTRQERVCQGFDFMKHCFLKSFYQLPLLMDPKDEN
ncbi:uncharacterized protein LOC107367130 isoform X2 [Tetranychus urticae]|nr:uncharacterized protein LOC107367130 isoform X2 [Tetranychus urticae]